MIFQRRFHSHTPTTIDSPPRPPPKDGPSPPKTLEEILAIAVSPRAPKPPPHAVGTVASIPRIVENTPLRSASSPLKSSVPKRAPSSRKTGHATIRTDGVNGHDAFESDAFAVHMPTTRIPIIEVPISRKKPVSPTRVQVEAVQTYKEKAKQARETNDNIGVRVPPNIASYDYAYAGTSKVISEIPDVLKPSVSPPAPAGTFPVSPPLPQKAQSGSEPRAVHTVVASKISSNTSVYRKPTVRSVATEATVVEESVHFVRADSKGGASRPTTPPKATTVKISMKPKTPSPVKRAAAPAINVQPCQGESYQTHAPDEQHCRGIHYRIPHVESVSPSRSPSPTKTMPNFTRQHSVEGDSIFGYRVKDPLGTVAGADKSVSSSSEDEKPKAPTIKTQNGSKKSQPKRTLTNRWPWIRKGATVGKPPSAPAPDPPVKAPIPRRPASIYTSPFEIFDSPAPTISIRATPPQSTAAAAKTAASTVQLASIKKTPAGPRGASAVDAPTTFDAGLQQIQSCLLLTLKVGLAIYIIVALWFILDAVREALCAVSVPLQFILMFVWTMVSFVGRTLGMIAGALGGKIRVLGR